MIFLLYGSYKEKNILLVIYFYKINWNVVENYLKYFNDLIFLFFDKFVKKIYIKRFLSIWKIIHNHKIFINNIMSNNFWFQNFIIKNLVETKKKKMFKYLKLIN